MVVNQIVPSTADSLGPEPTESSMIQLPLRPHLPAFDNMGNPIEPTETDQVSGDMERQMPLSSLGTAQVDVLVQNDAVSQMATFQDAQRPTLGEPQPKSIPGHHSGDGHWAFTNGFVQVGDPSGNSGNNPVDNGTRCSQLEGNVATSHWEQNWTEVSNNQATRQAWERLIPKY